MVTGMQEFAMRGISDYSLSLISVALTDLSVRIRIDTLIKIDCTHSCRVLPRSTSEIYLGRINLMTESTSP